MPPAPTDRSIKDVNSIKSWKDVAEVQLLLDSLHGGGLAWGIIVVNHKTIVPFKVKFLCQNHLALRGIR